VTIVPVTPQTVEGVLYGSRETSYRYEVLAHGTDGLDTLKGYLDGVVTASLQWSWTVAVKGKGSATVADLDEAQPGMLKIADLNLVTDRIRPVLVIDGLPEIPLGVYVITGAPEEWTATGRNYSLELTEKTIVLDQDATETSFVAPTGVPVLQIVRDLVEAAGETIRVDLQNTAGVSSEMVWDAGTSLLTIINDLLKVLNFNSLMADGQGNFLAAPYVRPAARAIRYEIIDLDRELVWGDRSVYTPDLTRGRDNYSVPNKVVAIHSSQDETLSGIATNEDPNSPYSYQSRGRWITNVLTGVEVPDGDEAAKQAVLDARARQSLIGSSSPQATVEVKHLPLPLWIGDVLRFQHTPSGVDARHVVVSLQLELSPTGLMTTNLQEVIDL